MLFNLGEHFPGPAAPEELRRSRDLSVAHALTPGGVLNWEAH
jgi:hypothetical protein